MNKSTDLGKAFDTLIGWMKENKKPSDRLGMTFEEWEERLFVILDQHKNLDIWVTTAQLREYFDQGIQPYAAYKKLEKLCQ